MNLATAILVTTSSATTKISLEEVVGGVSLQCGEMLILDSPYEFTMIAPQLAAAKNLMH